MDVSVFLAKVIGLFFVIVAITLFRNKQKLKTVFNGGLTANNIGLWVASLLNLMVGVLLVVSHNVWEGDWRILITLIAWFAFIVAIFRLFCPDHAVKMMTKLVKSNLGFKLAALVILLLGLYLCYNGFMS